MYALGLLYYFSDGRLLYIYIYDYRVTIITTLLFSVYNNYTFVLQYSEIIRGFHVKFSLQIYIWLDTLGYRP